jgi:hypothetical protein
LAGVIQIKKITVNLLWRFKMKLSKIAIACSMAFSAVAAQAASTGIPAAPANVVFVSGASGIDSYLGAVASNLINVTSYVHDSSNNYRAWYGTTKAAIGTLPAASNLLIIKRSAGGSAMGIGPLARSTKIEVPDWANAAAVADTTAGQFTVPVTTAANGLVPDIGASDVEPKMFTGINSEFGFVSLTPSEQATLTAKSFAQLAEGIVVTKAVADTTVLNNNFIREALDGHYSDWSVADGSADPIVICRRIEGSGTQAAYNSYFSGFPNTAAYNGFGLVAPLVTGDSWGFDGAHAGTAADPIIIDASAGFTVFEGSGSGDVRKCLQAAQNAADVVLTGRNGLKYNLMFSGVGAPSKAIGILSMDSYSSKSTAASRAAAVPVNVDGKGYATSNADLNGDWNFRFLNGNGTYDVAGQAVTSATSSGIAPSRTNILSGSYDFIVEPTLQYKTSALTGYKLAFYTKMLSLLGNPADMVVGSPNNGAPLAYAALPTLYTKGTTSPMNLVSDLTRQGNTTSPLHVKQ